MLKIYAKSGLQALRIKMGFNCSALSRAAGITCSTLRNVEKKQPCQPMTARRICGVLDKDFDDLFELREVRSL